MPVKSDSWIKKMSTKHAMIRPFSSKLIKKGISYGLSSYGYDIRVADEFKIFTNVNSEIIDPKKFSTESFVDVKANTASRVKSRNLFFPMEFSVDEWVLRWHEYKSAEFYMLTVSRSIAKWAVNYRSCLIA